MDTTCRSAGTSATRGRGLPGGDASSTGLITVGSVRSKDVGVAIPLGHASPRVELLHRRSGSGRGHPSVCPLGSSALYTDCTDRSAGAPSGDRRGMLGRLTDRNDRGHVMAQQSGFLLNILLKVEKHRSQLLV